MGYQNRVAKISLFLIPPKINGLMFLEQQIL